jgi:hypothetical protein
LLILLDTIKNSPPRTQWTSGYFYNPGVHGALSSEINSGNSKSNKDDLRALGHVDEITGSDDKQGSTCSI